jgi:anti-sigma factor RsiW
VDCHDARRMLEAFADNELAATEAASVRDHVTGCVTCARRLTQLERVGELVRRIPYYVAPDAVRVRVASTRKESWQAGSFLRWTAAAILVVSVIGSGMLVWSLNSSRTAAATRTIADAVVDNHVRALAGEHLFDVASSDQHTVKPWFQGKLDFSPPVTDLAATGFPLVGGRLEYVAGRPAAALIYRRRQHTINLFIWPTSDDARSTVARSIRGFQIRHWTRGGMSFWAVSDVNDSDLATFEQALTH